MIDISFCVSANNRPTELDILLGSLKLQRKARKARFEILVGINSVGRPLRDNIKVCQRHEVRFVANKCLDCYHQSNMLAKLAEGRFLCFPSDDNYYTPWFSHHLLRHAKRFKLDLVYCDMIYDDRVFGSYEVMRVQPMIDHIDKGGFLIKRERFRGFEAPTRENKDIPSFADGQMIEDLRKRGISYGKICEVLWVHN